MAYEIQCIKTKGEHPIAELNFYDGSKSCEELKSFVSTFWDENNLYIEFTGRFSQLRSISESNCDTPQLRTPKLWEKSDVFECFISPDCNRVYREFQIAPDSRYLDLAIDSSGATRKTDFEWNSHGNFRSEIDFKNRLWKSTMQLPWSAFGNKKPHSDECWRINFFRISRFRYKEIYMSWVPVNIISFHQPELFGKLIFQKQA